MFLADHSALSVPTYAGEKVVLVTSRDTVIGLRNYTRAWEEVMKNK